MILFDSHSLALHRTRALRLSPIPHALFQHVRQDLTDRVEDLKRVFKTIKSNIHENPALGKKSFDLIISCLEAHWENDLPLFLKNQREALASKGLFLGAVWGGQTLQELRESLMKAELSLMGGISPRVAPMVQSADACRLLSQAGFVDPVVDRNMVTLTYPSLWALMKDLRAMGETNKMVDRPKTFTPRKLFDEVETLYRHDFGLSKGMLPATFEVIYLTGWGG